MTGPEKLFFESAFLSSLGRRAKQEDSILTFNFSDRALSREDELRPRKLLAILADGLGGHVGGEFASQIVCNAFRDTFIKSMAGGFSTALKEALHGSNRKLHETVLQNPYFFGMGSTLVAAVFFTQSLLWISVGDSLLYLFRQGKITILNEDHSMGEKLGRENEFRGFGNSDETPVQAQNFLRSALTGGKISLIDLACCPLQIQNSDYIILASDGILTLSIPEIEHILSLNANEGPQGIAQSLIEAVESKDYHNQDNTSVIVVRLHEDHSQTLDRTPMKALEKELSKSGFGWWTTPIFNS